MEGRSQDVLGKYIIAPRVSATPMGVYFSMVKPCKSTISTTHPVRGSDVWTTLALPEHVVATRSFPIGDGSAGPGPSRVVGL